MSPSKHSTMPAAIWTIGHSTRPIEEFLGFTCHQPRTSVFPTDGSASSLVRGTNPSVRQGSTRNDARRTFDRYHGLQALGGSRQASPDSPRLCGQRLVSRVMPIQCRAWNSKRGRDQLEKRPINRSRRGCARSCYGGVFHRSRSHTALCVLGL